jgi:hypothetical protein
VAYELGYEPGPMGWVIPDATTERQLLDGEKRYFDVASADMPIAYRSRAAKDWVSEAMKLKWEKFQLDKGRFAGSQDLTLIDEFVFGKSFTWLPQDIGSCVWSNTFRRFFERMCVEIALRGDAEEFIGTDEYGPESLAPFCVSYGFARQRANMRSGDGLYCSPMQESLVKDGVVLCSTPKLIEMMNAAGAQDPRNYPEPRSAALYRKIGNWAWNEALKPYTSCRLLESPKITNIDQHNANVASLKPMFMCSMIAIRPVGTHADGFPIHARDTRTSWAHNMGWAGVRVASDGKRYHRLCNTSWLQGGTSDVEKFIYNIEESILDGWYKSGKIDVGTIGEIDGIPSLPESI